MASAELAIAELRSMTVEELNDELVRLRKEQFNMRLQRASEQLPQTHLIVRTRRDIARVKTLIREKARNREAARPEE